jgi:hypothetical protein
MNQPIDARTGKGTLYSGSLNCVIVTMRKEGVLAIYKGFTAQWLRYVNSNSVLWTCSISCHLNYFVTNIDSNEIICNFCVLFPKTIGLAHTLQFL